MNQSDFCLLMLLFQIAWYFKIFCLKTYKSLARKRHILWSWMLIYSVSFVDGDWVAVFGRQNMAFGWDEYFVPCIQQSSNTCHLLENYSSKHVKQIKWRPSGTAGDDFRYSLVLKSSTLPLLHKQRDFRCFSHKYFRSLYCSYFKNDSSWLYKRVFKDNC